MACNHIKYMGCVTDGGLYLVTILMGDRESLPGVGLIVSICTAVWLKALYEPYRVIGGVWLSLSV